MAALSGVFKIGSMTDSLSVYVPAIICQKAIGLGRLVLLTHLLSELQFGLWGLGIMIFDVLAAVVCLGSNHGLMRYVSHYEARGQLERFYRRIRWCVAALTLALTAVAMLGSDVITQWVISSPVRGAQVTYGRQLWICWLALGNAMVMALYHSMLGFMVGMRAYRLVSMIEVLLAAVFTVAATAGVLLAPTAIVVLAAHLGAVALSLAIGMCLLRAAIRRVQSMHEAGGGQVQPDAAPGEITDAAPAGVGSVGLADGDGDVGGQAFRRVVRFGAAALLGPITWQIACYVSFFMTNRYHGQGQAGVYWAFMRLSQPIVFITNAVWAVVYSHVARQWEDHRRDRATFMLETAYKAVAMTVMTLAVLLYLASPVWVKVLAPAHRPGRELLGGLLMFFQVLNHLAVMTMLAKLHERPIIIAVAGLAGAGVNVLLAILWMPGHGPGAAAWAAGVGMFIGAGVVTAAYFLIARIALQPSTLFVMAAPALLALTAWTPWALPAAWGGVLGAAVFTRLLFNGEQKQVLASQVRELGRLIGRIVGRPHGPAA